MLFFFREYRLNIETSRSIIKPFSKTIVSSVLGQSKKSLSIIEENPEKSHHTNHTEAQNKKIDIEKKSGSLKLKERNFANDLIRISFINIFIKKLKLVSGKYGPLKNNQLRVINDITGQNINQNPEEEGNPVLDTNNILVRLIVRIIIIILI